MAGRGEARGPPPTRVPVGVLLNGGRAAPSPHRYMTWGGVWRCRGSRVSGRGRGKGPNERAATGHTGQRVAAACWCGAAAKCRVVRVCWMEWQEGRGGGMLGLEGWSCGRADEDVSGQ